MAIEIGVTRAADPVPTTTRDGPAEVSATKRVSEQSGRDQAKPEELVGSQKTDADVIDDVVGDLNNLVQEMHRELQFSVDNESGDTVIKVVDSETEQVIREIPSEEVLRMRKRLEAAAGLIFQDSA